MTYPEKNAGYKNRPAWLDRAVAGEKRADGGDIEDQKIAMGNQMGQAANVTPNMDPYNKPMSEQGSGTKSFGTRVSDFISDHVTGPQARERISKGVGQSLGFKRGGMVKNRAEGGGVEDPGWGRRLTGTYRLRNEMAGTPSPTGFDFTRRKDQAEDTMRGQMERAKDISDAVPRKPEE